MKSEHYGDTLIHINSQEPTPTQQIKKFSIIDTFFSTKIRIISRKIPIFVDDRQTSKRPTSNKI